MQVCRKLIVSPITPLCFPRPDCEHEEAITVPHLMLRFLNNEVDSPASGNTG